MDHRDIVIAVIGLGYVGLPLAVEFGKRYRTIGFDISRDRVLELLSGHDRTKELSEDDFEAASKLEFTFDSTLISAANIFIVTVPTPITKNKHPDLGPLLRASETVGRHLGAGDIVVYESTVYPGATEEVCVPILEQESGMEFNIDFFCGYSPERINPGDKARRLPHITKIISGSTPEAAQKIDALYSEIISAGTYRVESIRVAEAAKVIENTQRDINIALMNEFSMIFSKLGIDTETVLRAAETKWNFLSFRPGLVGGHCIGVDPYYLTHKAQEVGYHPEMILAGRRINDGMGEYVANKMVKEMIRRKLEFSRVLVLGLAFKENCPDLRNTRVIDLVDSLSEYGLDVDVHDPVADSDDANSLYGIQLIQELVPGTYSGVILAVAHKEYIVKSESYFRSLCKDRHLFYDLKSVFTESGSDFRL